MKEKLGVNPWLSIWTSPRKSIRTLIHYSTNHRIIALSAIYGFLYMLQLSHFLSLGTGNPLWMILLISIIFALPAGYIIFNVMSFFNYFLGKLIKGKGTFKEIRAATYWSSVPCVISVLLYIVQIVVFRNELFVAGYETQVMGGAALLTLIVGIIQRVITVWVFIIFLHALGEVQGFSAWMALLNVFLSGLTIAILLFLFSWGFSALVHVK